MREGAGLNCRAPPFGPSLAHGFRHADLRCPGGRTETESGADESAGHYDYAEGRRETDSANPEEEGTSQVIPFPLAATKNEARDNALYLAGCAADDTDPSEVVRCTALAAVWSGIAMTFPDQSAEWDLGPGQQIEESYHPRPAEDTQVIELPRRQVVSQSQLTYGNNTVMVDADLWAVLRVLAVRYVMSSMTHTATVDLRQVEPEDLVLIRNGDEPIIQAMLETPRN